MQKIFPHKSYVLVVLVFFITTLVNAQTTDKTISNMVSKIQTAIDSNFVYDYEKTKFVPPAGKTLLIMGQTAERIEEYMYHFKDKPIPGGWSAYWGIPAFKGIKKRHKNDTGSSQHHQMLVDNFPNAAIQSAMWMVGRWNIPNNIVNGEFDKVIKKYSAWAKATKRPIYLRIGYEFDGPHNELKPNEYIAAYRHIVNLMRKRGVKNVAFVWHSYAAKPYKNYKLSDYYPGDDYVDWVAISVFGHAHNKDFGKYTNNVLEFAKTHKKPVMIAESNPIYGIKKDNAAVWDTWFVNYFSFIYKHNIKAVSFISEDWTSLNIPGIADWKDSRLHNNKKVYQAWFTETSKDYYLKQSPTLFKQLEYKK